MILIDSNVFMYAAGKSHPFKVPSVALLEKIAESEVEAAIDTEVLQEILHRFRSLGRWKDGRALYDLVRKIFPQVIPITVSVVDHARILLDEYSHLMARDALHAAVVEVHGWNSICSYDNDFDRIKTIKRLEPGDLL